MAGADRGDSEGGGWRSDRWDWGGGSLILLRRFSYALWFSSQVNGGHWRAWGHRVCDIFQKDGSGALGCTRAATGRPVQRLLQKTREDVRISWTREVAGKVMRNGWVLTPFWKAELTRFLDG